MGWGIFLPDAVGLSGAGILCDRHNFIQNGTLGGRYSGREAQVTIKKLNKKRLAINLLSISLISYGFQWLTPPRTLVIFVNPFLFKTLAARWLLTPVWQMSTTSLFVSNSCGATFPI